MFRLRQPPPWAEPLLGLRAWRKLPALPARKAAGLPGMGRRRSEDPVGFPQPRGGEANEALLGVMAATHRPGAGSLRRTAAR